MRKVFALTLRLGALHDALLMSGDADLARKAAEEVAAYDRGKSDVRSDLILLKWMAGTNLVLTVGILMRVFSQ